MRHSLAVQGLWLRLQRQVQEEFLDRRPFWEGRDDLWLARKLPPMGDSTWADMTRMAVGCTACRFDGQVYGDEIDFA